MGTCRTFAFNVQRPTYFVVLAVPLVRTNAYISQLSSRVESVSVFEPVPNSKMVALPHLPQEIIDGIIDLLAGDAKSLRSCSLVSTNWVNRTRLYLFTSVRLCSLDKLRIFSRTMEHMSHHVRLLRLVQYTTQSWITPDALEVISASCPNFESLALAGMNLTHCNQYLQFRDFSKTLTALTLTKLELDPDTLICFVCMFPKLDNLMLDNLRMRGCLVSSPIPATFPSFQGKLTLLNIDNDFAYSVIAPFVHHPHLVAFREVHLDGCGSEISGPLKDLFVACHKTVKIVKVFYTCGFYLHFLVSLTLMHLQNPLSSMPLR